VSSITFPYGGRETVRADVVQCHQFANRGPKENEGSSKIVRCIGAAVKSDGHPARTRYFSALSLILKLSSALDDARTLRGNAFFILLPLVRTLHAHFCTTVFHPGGDTLFSFELMIRGKGRHLSPHKHKEGRWQNDVIKFQWVLGDCCCGNWGMRSLAERSLPDDEFQSNRYLRRNCRAGGDHRHRNARGRDPASATPIAVTVFSGNALDESGANNIKDVRISHPM